MGYQNADCHQKSLAIAENGKRLKSRGSAKEEILKSLSQKFSVCFDSEGEVCCLICRGI